MLPTRLLVFLAFSVFFALPARAVTVVGVIASDAATKSVALIRTSAGGAPVVVKPGQEVAQGVVVQRITREFVYFSVKGRIERARVGEDLETSASSSPSPVAVTSSGGYTGFQREGNTVRVTAQLRDHIVRNELGKVLMQAAAVPYYSGGKLVGFRLWDIDAGSIYELAGFQNGDIVTAINGQDLIDVGMTIRMLQGMKNETDAAFTVQRAGKEETLVVSIQ